MRYIQLRMEGTYRRWKLRGLAGSNVYGEQLYDRKGQDWKGADRISVE